MCGPFHQDERLIRCRSLKCQAQDAQKVSLSTDLAGVPISGCDLVGEQRFERCLGLCRAFRALDETAAIDARIGTRCGVEDAGLAGCDTRFTDGEIDIDAFLVGMENGFRRWAGGADLGKQAKPPAASSSSAASPSQFMSRR